MYLNRITIAHISYRVVPELHGQIQNYLKYALLTQHTCSNNVLDLCRE